MLICCDVIANSFVARRAAIANVAKDRPASRSSAACVISSTSEAMITHGAQERDAERLRDAIQELVRGGVRGAHEQAGR